MNEFKQKFLALSFIVTSLLVLSSLSHADQGNDACSQDVQKLCADVQPGGGRILGCLKEHQADVSQPCKDQLVATGQKMKVWAQQVAQACKTDQDKFCANVQPGGGRILGCLKQNYSSLRPDCQQALTPKAAPQSTGAPAAGAPPSDGQ